MLEWSLSTGFPYLCIILANLVNLPREMIYDKQTYHLFFIVLILCWHLTYLEDNILSNPCFQIRLYDMTGVRLARLPRNDRLCHRRMVSAATWVENSNGYKTKLLTCGWDKLILGWAVNIPNNLINHVK